MIGLMERDEFPGEAAGGRAIGAVGEWQRLEREPEERELLGFGDPRLRRLGGAWQWDDRRRRRRVSRRLELALHYRPADLDERHAVVVVELRVGRGSQHRNRLHGGGLVALAAFRRVQYVENAGHPSLLAGELMRLARTE